MHTKRLLRRLALSALLVPVILELALRAIFSVFIAQAGDGVPGTVGIAPAYASATFDVSAFTKEHDQMFEQNYYADDGLYFTPDYHGTYINIRNNHRATTDQPTNAPHVLYLFGSSAIWNIEVPDRYTIASALQRRIGSAYRVENMGLMAADAPKQLRVLKNTPLKPGDVVVFYDGFIDAMMQPRTITQNRAATGVCPWLVKHVPWSSLILVMCHLNIVPEQSLIDAGLRDYRISIIQAHDYTQDHGATFYHFIQATIYATESRAEEASLAFDRPLYNRAWPALRDAPYTVDLSDCLSGIHQSGPPLFFDEIHVNQWGDAVIAQALYTALFVF